MRKNTGSSYNYLLQQQILRAALAGPQFCRRVSSIDPHYMLRPYVKNTGRDAVQAQHRCRLINSSLGSCSYLLARDSHSCCRHRIQRPLKKPSRMTVPKSIHTTVRAFHPHLLTCELRLECAYPYSSSYRNSSD